MYCHAAFDLKCLVYWHSVIVGHYVCSNRFSDLHSMNFQNLAVIVSSQAANPLQLQPQQVLTPNAVHARQAMHVPTIALTNTFQLALTPDLARHTANKGVNQGY